MTVEYKKILVAIDGSEASERTLEHACAIARTNNSDVIVLQVLEPNPEDYYADPIILPEIIKADEEREKKIKETLTHDIQNKLREDYDFEKGKVGVLVLRGYPKNTIVECAKDEEVDLVIVGATGKHGIKKALLGTTAAYVVNHADCAVLTVK